MPISSHIKSSSEDPKDTLAKMLLESIARIEGMINSKIKSGGLSCSICGKAPSVEIKQDDKGFYFDATDHCEHTLSALKEIVEGHRLELVQLKDITPL